MGPLDLKCCQQQENLQVLHLEMSFKLLNLVCPLEPQNEDNLKKDKTLVDPVFKKPGIICIRTRASTCVYYILISTAHVVFGDLPHGSVFLQL